MTRKTKVVGEFGGQLDGPVFGTGGRSLIIPPPEADNRWENGCFIGSAYGSAHPAGSLREFATSW